MVSVPAGVLVDRFNRKGKLVAAEAVRGLAVLAIPSVEEGPFLVPGVMAVALVASTMAAFFDPAYQALIPRLVDPGELDTANSLLNLTSSTVRLFYVVGGLVVGLGGTFVAFYVNSATFVLAAVVLLAVPTAAGSTGADTGRPDEPRPSVLAEAREGRRSSGGPPRFSRSSAWASSSISPSSRSSWSCRCSPR